jgi:hypothetical protein
VPTVLEPPTDTLDDAAPDQAAGAAKPSAVEKGRKIDYARDAKIIIDRVLADAQNNNARLDRDRQDWLNLKFDRGGPDNQWVVWDQGTNRFVKRGTDPKQGGIPEGVPRVVTNVFSNKINGITAILDQSTPAQVWAPATDDDADRATAEVIEDVIPVLFDEIGYRAGDLRTQIHKSICLTDKVGVCVWYDTDEKYGFAPVPLLQCQNPECDCLISPMEFEDAGEVCPECGGEDVGDAIDGLGQPVETHYPKGKMRARLYESFELSLPRSARSIDAHAVPWVLAHSRYSEAEALAAWPNAKAAIKDKQATPAGTGGIQRQYADAMRQLSSPRVSSEAHMAGGGKTLDGPVVYIVWHDPVDDGEVYLPHGLYAVQINGQIVEPGPLPVNDDDGCPKKNILLRTYQHQAGTGYGKPPADDLQPLQVTRNTVETLILLILMHDAAPRTFVPLSVTLEDEITGLPAETIRYRSHVPGEKPTTDRGMNPPEGLYKYLEILDAKFDEISNLNAVLQGARPDGDPTAFEIETLKERGMSAFRGPLDQLIRFEIDLARLCLCIARQSAWSTRFRKVRGENGAWEIREFSAADLTGKVDVQVDPVSAWPKSPMMQLSRFEKALTLGILPPAMQDPELQLKALTLLDLTEMRPSMDVDRKQVARELDRWKAAQTPLEIAPPDPLCNIDMHLFLKSMFLKTEECEQLAQMNSAVYQAMRQHVSMLQGMVAMRQAAAAAAQQPQKPGKPDDRSNVEKGDTSTLDGALESGALRPAGAGGANVQDLVTSGALVPAGATQAAAPGGPSIDDLMAAGAMTPAAGPQRPV